ncbi:GTP-binding protein [uncultured virus]|nr:GTP-binding protein [uncultured virus]
MKISKRFLLTGHVDHGKSSLGGQLLYQCGALDEREVQKIFEQAEQEKMYSFRWARLLDINTEERERGVTIESNEIEFDYHNDKYKLIDTPGHKLYIRHLIEAIYRNTADGNVIGVLVLSALPSELEAAMSSGQVKEDILLLRAVGVDSIVVAINKLDKYEWLTEQPCRAREAFDKTKNTIFPMLKSARYKQIAFAACSGLEGKGIIDRSFTDIPPLMDSIIDLSATVTSNKGALKSLELSTISAEIFILNCNIFSPGYIGMIHMNQGEYSFTVDEVKKLSTTKKTKSMPFIKTGDRGRVMLTLSDKIMVNDKDRIVLRNSDRTIAYGVVTL